MSSREGSGYEGAAVETRSVHELRLGLINGDGIGPEVMPAVARIVDKACATSGISPVEWKPLAVGFEAIERGEPALPASTLEGLSECDAWLLGPVDFLAYPDEYRRGRNPSGELRHRFDLYANIRPSRTFDGVGARLDDADVVIVRENSEGFYADRNMLTGSGDLRVTEDVALAVGVFTRAASVRIARVAGRLALSRRRRVAIVHKANVLANSMGLFLDTAREALTEYDVEVEDYHADAMAAHLVRRPEEFDVVLCENFIGDVFSDLMGELTGSLGLAPSLNVGDRVAMAQAAHGAAPDIAGKNIANPVGEILSAAMLFEWLGSRRAEAGLGKVGALLQDAVARALASGVRTVDAGGETSLSDFTEEIIGRLG